ncbi:hypothetical protein CXR13_06670 [Enterococcus faecium]|nr:hypothetical protein CXR13_06670 [Enterococcus faecium]
MITEVSYETLQKKKTLVVDAVLSPTPRACRSCGSTVVDGNGKARDISGLPETYTTTLRTFKKFLPQIQNALHYSYSNGPLECLNNHIKVLKRNAYGFRNFYNFKLRIMIRHGKTFLTK